LTLVGPCLQRKALIYCDRWNRQLAKKRTGNLQ